MNVRPSAQMAFVHVRTRAHTPKTELLHINKSVIERWSTVEKSGWSYATARAAAKANHAATATQNKQQQETDQRALVGVAPPPQPAARLGAQQQMVGLSVLPVLQLVGYLDSPTLPLHLTGHPKYTAQASQLIVQAVISHTSAICY